MTDHVPLAQVADTDTATILTSTDTPHGGGETSAMGGSSKAVSKSDTSSAGGQGVASVSSGVPKDAAADYDAESESAAAGTTSMSINQRRKAKRKAGWVQKKALSKQKKKEEREGREEAMRKAGQEIVPAGKLWRDLPPEQWSVSQKIRMAKKTEFEELAKAGGYRVCVDMSFNAVMGDKARESLVQQIAYLYGANRKATQPCQVTLTGMGPAEINGFKKISGFNSWLATAIKSQCYTDVFDKDDLVYLTADSPDAITQLEKGKVYILGGLVDRNTHKGMCYTKAVDHGIATAKLPIKKEDLRGTHSKVLSTNQVFSILLNAMGSGGNLTNIKHETLPPRKRAGWTGGDSRCRETSNVKSEITSDGANAGTGLGRASADDGSAEGAGSIETDDTKEAGRVNGQGGSDHVVVAVGRTGQSETGCEASTVTAVAVVGDGGGTGEAVERGGRNRRRAVESHKREAGSDKVGLGGQIPVPTLARNCRLLRMEKVSGVPA